MAAEMASIYRTMKEINPHLKNQEANEETKQYVELVSYSVELEKKRAAYSERQMAYIDGTISRNTGIH